jgi:hypothetical protein
MFTSPFLTLTDLDQTRSAAFSGRSLLFLVTRKNSVALEAIWAAIEGGGLGLGTPQNEVLSNSHGDAIAPEISMRGARGSRFADVVVIDSRSKRTGER